MSYEYTAVTVDGTQHIVRLERRWYSRTACYTWAEVRYGGFDRNGYQRWITLGDPWPTRTFPKREMVREIRNNVPERYRAALHEEAAAFPAHLQALFAYLQAARIAQLRWQTIEVDYPRYHERQRMADAVIGVDTAGTTQPYEIDYGMQCGLLHIAHDLGGLGSYTLDVATREVMLVAAGFAPGTTISKCYADAAPCFAELAAEVLA